MKLNYSSNKVDILYRKTNKRKAKKQKFIRKLVKFLINTIMIFIIIFLIIFTGIKFLMHKKFFNIKNIDIVYVNNNEILNFEKMDTLQNINIFSIHNDSINKLFEKFYPSFGIRNILKIYPHTIRLAVYKKTPILSINNKYSIYNDMSMKKIPAVNTLNLSCDINNIESIFSIPGLPTLFDSLIKYKKFIKNIVYKDNIFYIKLKNNKKIILNAGDELKNVEKITDMEYSKIDLRYKKLIIVKK